MHSMMKKAGLGIALAATALTAAAPAEAQRYGGRGYGGHGYRGGGNAGPAIVAGIAGLAIGAAIASNANDRYRDRYYIDRGYPIDYDYRYYNDHGYYPQNGYYAYRYRDRYPRCYTERRWDRYYRQPVLVRVCR
ncbi:MAG: hypothetical protein B7Y45_10065 [Sphingomonas sp. 28-66-16]|nr:MAG: hypothetical protein B7Y45_10065 [Sphingomonas sp. 28-66-16]